ncbi:MAG: hypothetical protein IKP64_06375 [Selenomonadaceae bacterium]|nr:hypothetical protein [Selenomonadaceae bacterium]MBR4383168.1 hypothetical protein [Selenomonadaceae bacterium]
MAKEILENEILSEDELDNVAGGSWRQFRNDMFEAKERGIEGFENIDPYNLQSDLFKMMRDEKLRYQYVDKMVSFFASHGITMEYHEKGAELNIYTYKGNRITSDQAWNIVDGK